MDGERHGRTPRYDGEDVSPTSSQELKGWYSAGLAAEVYVSGMRSIYLRQY